MSRHVMEVLGMSKVVFEDGKVVSVSEPKVKYCPLFKKYRQIDEINCDSVRENMEFRMERFGMCCENREVRMKNFLSFGISEIISLAMFKGVIDAAVIAADGCGTCVLTDPEIIQGMGGRISGIIETSPIPRVVEAIGRENILGPDTTPIDQVAGAEKAFSMGYWKVAVTVAKASDAVEIRKRYGDSVALFAVHTTGTSERDARTYFETCDVITACASKWIREVAKTEAIIQAGTKVPVYGASEFGERFIRLKLEELGRIPDTVLEDGPRPLL